MAPNCGQSSGRAEPPDLAVHRPRCRSRQRHRALIACRHPQDAAAYHMFSPELMTWMSRSRSPRLPAPGSPSPRRSAVTRGFRAPPAALAENPARQRSGSQNQRALRYGTVRKFTAPYGRRRRRQAGGHVRWDPRPRGAGSSSAAPRAATVLSAASARIFVALGGRSRETSLQRRSGAC